MNKKIKILIAEDEVLIAKWLKIELEDAGYEVFDFVTTGEDTLAVSLEKKPDIILLDIHLASEMDGIDAAEKIYSEMNIPVIFMTGYNEADVIERAQKTKPVALIEKPVGLYNIKPIIDSIFE
ncbi:MAG: response regulator [Candidatus Cloacimonetes bacterium]|nr:response regulator [Candidatus Cloacimonadota bacterium]